MKGETVLSLFQEPRLEGVTMHGCSQKARLGRRSLDGSEPNGSSDGAEPGDIILTNC